MNFWELAGYTEHFFAGAPKFKMGLLLTAGTSHSFLSL